MFDWNNLFLSCPHCNSVKNQKKYEEHIIDCCKEDPEASIRQELVDSHVVVTAIESTEDAIRTAGLLTECFEKENTGIRILECQTRVNALQTTMTTLYRCLANYKQNPSQRNYRTLRGMLNRSHKFAGFTRTYVRNHIDVIGFKLPQSTKSGALMQGRLIGPPSSPRKGGSTAANPAQPPKIFRPFVRCSSMAMHRKSVSFSASQMTIC